MRSALTIAFTDGATPTWLIGAAIVADAAAFSAVTMGFLLGRIRHIGPTIFLMVIVGVAHMFLGSVWAAGFGVAWLLNAGLIFFESARPPKADQEVDHANGESATDPS